MSEPTAVEVEDAGGAPLAGPAASPASVGAVGTAFAPLTLAELAGSAAAAAAGQAGPTPAGPPEGIVEAPEPAAVAVTGKGERHARNMGCVRDALLVALGALGGSMLALAVLFYVNGTLDFGQAERIKLIESGTATIEQQMGDLSGHLRQQATAMDQVKADAAADAQRIAALKAQSDAVQTAASDLDRRLAQAETKSAAQDAAIAGAVQTAGELRSQLDAANAQIATLQESANRLQQTAQDLQAQLAGAATVQPAVTPGVSSTPEAMAPASPTSGQSAILMTPALQAFPSAIPIAAPRSGQGHLFGVIWADGNGNGQPDAGEEPIPGARVILRSPLGADLATSVTGADGRYLFADLDPNLYGLAVFIPSPLSSAQARTIAVTVGSDKAVEVNVNSLAP